MKKRGNNIWMGVGRSAHWVALSLKTMESKRAEHPAQPFECPPSPKFALTTEKRAARKQHIGHSFNLFHLIYLLSQLCVLLQ